MPKLYSTQIQTRSEFQRILPRNRVCRQRRRRVFNTEPLETRELLTGDFVFASTSGNPGPLSAMVVAPDGNTIVAGVDTQNDLVFVRELNSNGSEVWSRTAILGGSGDTPSVDSMALDASGNIYLTGEFKYGTDFDSGSGVVEPNRSFGRGYLLKLTALGDFVWVRQMPRRTRNLVEVGSSGNIFVVGQVGGMYNFSTFPTSVEQTLITTAGSFLVRYNAEGTLTQTRQFGGFDLVNGESLNISQMAIGSGEQIYLSGGFKGTSDVNPHNELVHEINSGAEKASFVLNLNSSGQFVWAKTMTESETPTGMAISAVGLYVSDSTHVKRLGVAGATMFSREIAEPGAGVSRVSARGLAVDAKGYAYLTGQYEGTVDFDSGPGKSLRTATHPGSFVQRIDPSGDFGWITTFDSDVASDGHFVDVSPSGLITTLGTFQGKTDFDGGLPVAIRDGGLGNGRSYVSRITPDFVYNTTATNQQLILRRTQSGMVQLLDKVLNKVVEEHPLSAIRDIKISGQRSHSETLTIDFAYGGAFSPQNEVIFEGGLSGTDKLQLIGIAGQVADYLPAKTANGMSQIRVGTKKISFGGTESVLFAGVTTLSVQTQGSADILNLQNSIGINGAIASRLTGSSDGAAIPPAIFSNVRDVFIDTGARDTSASAGIDSLTATESGLKASGMKNLTVSTGIGDDSLSVKAANLRLGLAGGSFRFFGGSGSDTIIGTGNTNLTLNNTSLSAGGGGQLFLNNTEKSVLNGGSGNNTIDASSFPGVAILNGLAGNDTLRASLGGGQLNGGDGNDTLISGLANDELIGGLGTDSYLLRGTSTADDLRLERTRTGARFVRRARNSSTVLESDSISLESQDTFNIRALEGDDLISIDMLFTQLGTVDGGTGSDTGTAPVKWKRISF